MGWKSGFAKLLVYGRIIRCTLGGCRSDRRSTALLLLPARGGATMNVARGASIPNEVLLLEARLNQQKAQTHPHLDDDDYFLVSSVDTVIRSRGLSNQEIESGIVEGTNDGGIDAVYVFQDGNLIEDNSPLSGSERPQLALEIIQAKNEQGFKELVIQRLIDHLPLLLQLDRSDNLAAEFNDRVLEQFDLFRTTLLNLSSKFPALAIRIHYITKAVEPAHEKVLRKAQRLKQAVKELFPHSGFALHATLAGPAAWAWRSSSRVGVTSRDGRNWAAGSSRRSALSMSASDTVCLVRYQGARARWAATSAAGWPCWAYQHTTRLTHSRPKGTVRWTARGVRLRAWPTPATCRLSSNKTSTCQRAA